MYEEGLTDCNKAIEMKRGYDFVLQNENRGIAYKNRGIAYKNLGKIDEALKDFTSASKFIDDPELLEIVSRELEEISKLTK